MDQENVFSRLRRLASKVENEVILIEKRMQNPPDQRVASGVSANNILKEIQYDVHRLKSDVSKELTKQQEENPFQDILKACENLISVNKRQGSILKEYIVQYGYEPLQQQIKQRKSSSCEDKKTTEQNGVSTSTAVNEEQSLNMRPCTPPKGGASIPKVDLDRTPKEEDYDLSVGRVNIFLKKDIPTSSKKVVDVSYSDRSTTDVTAVYQISDRLNLEDSGLSVSSESQASLPASGKQHTHIFQNVILQHGEKTDHIRPDSIEPQSPDITSWFPQGPGKPPVQPMVSLQPESFTPPTPDCQATEKLCVMPQEPKRLMDPVEKAEPQEPDQHYPKVKDITPELPPSLSDSAYRGKLSTQKNMTTPVHVKKLPSHLAVWQEQGTPKTPEFTISLKQMNCRPIPSFQPDRSVSQVTGTYSKMNHVMDLQTPTYQDVLPQSSPPCVYLAPITEEEFSSLSHKMKKNLCLEKVNSWITIIDSYIADKPMGEKLLCPKDMEALQGYPWLRVVLILMVNFERMVRTSEGDDHVFIPCAVASLDQFSPRDL